MDRIGGREDRLPDMVPRQSISILRHARAGRAFLRVRIGDRKIERILDLTDLAQRAGSFGLWTGLAPDDSPPFMRDASFDEIYALDWEAP
jgi:hypothetical protein